jgi:nucleotide-binding universal stress UspA family protein
MMPQDPSKGQEESEFVPFPPRKILVAVDGSDNSLRAVKVAIDIAKKYKSELRILHVISRSGIILRATSTLGRSPVLTDRYDQAAEDKAVGFLSEMMSIARASQVHCTEEILRTGRSVVDGIVQDALREDAELIVIGTRGIGGFRRLLQGSVSSGVFTHSSSSVLVVR